jgi:excisionase family DNA binding protein
MKTEYIKAKELAKRLNLDPRTVRRLTQEGHLPHIQIGKTRRYDWHLINEMIKVNYPTHPKK